MKKCEVCGTEFEAKGRQKFCSEACKQKNKRTGDNSLDKLNAKLKELGSTAVAVKGSDVPPIEFVTSGILEIDELTGGIPKSRITEIFGLKGVGKTFLAKKIMRNMKDLKILYIDTENALTDPPENVTTVPEYQLEAVADMVNDSLGQYDVVIIDSVASLIPRAEIEGEQGDAHMGLKARSMGQWMRRINPYLNGSGTAVLFINQQRESMNPYGPPKYTPGGHALPYAASLRLELKTTKAERIVKDSQVIGHWVNVEVEKSRVCRPWQKTRFKLIYDV